MEPTYRQAISHAWHLVWHHKLIWVFGAVSLLLGQFGLNNFVGQILFYSADTFSSTVNAAQALAWLLGTTETTQGFVLFMWLGCIVLSFAALVTVAAVAARGALIDAAAEWYKKKHFPSLATAWHKGAKHFWRLFALTVLEKSLLGLILGLVLLMVSMYGFSDAPGSFVVATVAVFVGTLLALVVSVVGVYAAGYIVVAEDDVMVSIVRGWGLFLNHMLVSLELSILLLLMNVVLVLVLSGVSFLVLVPSFFFTLAGGLTGNLVFVAMAAVSYILLFVVSSACIGSLFNAFTTSAWTYLFMKMHHEGIASRIIHWARTLKNV